VKCISSSLEQKDWSSILSESEVIDTNWKKFVDILRSLQDKYIPENFRRQLGKSKSKFPMDRKRREKIRKKNILSRKLIHKIWIVPIVIQSLFSWVCHKIYIAITCIVKR
jgi:hypothetical protein